MKIIIFISAVCLQLQWSGGKTESVGSFAYSDTAGNRYGGTYKDGQVYNYKNTDDTTTFGPNPFTDFQDLDTFFPEYFRNLENLLQEVFAKNADQQQKALNAARKAFDLTSNHAGYVPNFDTDFNRFAGFQDFGFPQQEFNMPGFGSHPGFGTPFGQPNFGPVPNFARFADNQAYASGAVGPGFRHQMVGIHPTNPSMPNIHVSQLSDAAPSNRNGGFYSVQSSSFVTSSNVNGEERSRKGGETIVNENGKITKYSLNS